jgi:cell fate regulator YaaT (PSP1 superfamily)
MGCGNCGTGASGKPSGCKSNGGCSTGGCNRMNVFDWLSALPLHDSAKPYPVIEVSFNKGSRKEFYRYNSSHSLDKGQWITVEGVSGFDMGQVSLTGELVKLQLKKYGVDEQSVMKRVLRPATDEDIDIYDKNKIREPEMLTRSRTIARNLNLDMKLCEIEIQADGRKATFFYTADQRVDFRELIKIYASDFKVKVEMRQIGARQESGKVGGIGSCGRELCCSTWLSDFKSVNTTAARYQNLAINQTKLSGQCGRLKCCLNYELDTYMDALRVFPDNAESLQTVKGNATLQKKDIFKNLMWYSYSDSNKQYPLSIVRVKEIQKLNSEGKKPDELQPVELETSSNKAGIKVDVGFVNDVGQISLKALEKSSRKKGGNKANSNSANRPQQQGAGGRPQQQQGGGNRPQQGQQRQRPAQQDATAGKPQPQGGAPRPQQAAGNKPQPQQGSAPKPQQPQGNRPQPQQGGAPKPQRPQGNRPQQQQGGEPKPQSNRPQPQPGSEPKPQQPQGNNPQQGENKPQQQSQPKAGNNRPQNTNPQQGQRPRRPQQDGGGQDQRPPREQKPQPPVQ